MSNMSLRKETFITISVEDDSVTAAEIHENKERKHWIDGQLLNE